MQTIAQIKADTDIVDVIGNHIALEEKTGRWWACCPFHDEDTASLCVFPEKQRWKCFGCNEGGDVFDFLQRFHDCNLPQAAKIIRPDFNAAGGQVAQVKRKEPDLWKRIALWKDLHFGHLSESYRAEVFDRALDWAERHPCYDQRTPIVRLYLQWRSEVVRSPAALSEYRWRVWVWLESLKSIRRIFKRV